MVRSGTATPSGGVLSRLRIRLLALALAGGLALPPAAAAGSLPVAAGGEAGRTGGSVGAPGDPPSPRSPAGTGAVGARNVRPGAPAPRVGESPSRSDVGDEHGDGRAGVADAEQPVPTRAGGREHGLGEAAVEIPRAASRAAGPDARTIPDARRERERHSRDRVGDRAAGRRISASAPAGSTAPRDHRAPTSVGATSGDDGDRSRPVPAEPDSALRPETAGDNAGAARARAGRSSARSGHGGRPGLAAGNRPERDVPRPVTSVPSPDVDGRPADLRGPGRDDAGSGSSTALRRSSDTPLSGDVGASEPMRPRQPVLPSAPGDGDQRRAERGATGGDPPAVGERGGAGALAGSADQLAAVPRVVGGPQRAIARREVEGAPSSMVAPLEWRVRTRVAARSRVAAGAPRAGLVAAGGGCAWAGAGCGSVERQLGSEAVALWRGDGESSARRRAPRGSNGRDAALDRDLVGVGPAPEPGGAAGEGFGPAGFGYVAMLTSWLVVLAGLSLVARFAAQAVWRSLSGPLPLERPG